MTRKSTVNRTHRTARRTVREPETIEEAREIILQLVPNGCTVHLFASWFDERSKGSKYSRVGYNCSLFGGPFVLRAELEASSPAGLVRAVYNALQAQQPRERQPQATVVVKTSDLVDVLKLILGTDEFQDSKRRLASPQLPRLVSGETA